MSTIMLIEKIRGQITREIAVHDIATLNALQGATYIIVDSETQQQPENLVLKRKGDQLEIEVDDKPVAIIDQFYAEGTAASFSISAEASAESIVASSQDPAQSNDPEAVVWPVSDSSGVLWGSLASVGALLANSGSGSSAEEVTPTPTPTPSSYNIVVSAAAGPFVSEVQVDIYDQKGNVLGSGQYDVASGQFKLTISSDYEGPFVVFVSDINGDLGDYLDEATNTLVSLGEPLRAMGNANGKGDVYLSVTPLTELAARKANIPDKTTIDTNNTNGTQTVIVTEANLEANTQVATLFGLDDILAPVTTVVDANFKTADGINSAERYGEVLAQLSGADKHTGSLSNTLKQLEDAIVPQASSTTGQNSLAMNQEGVDLLKKGVEKFEEGENKDKADLGNSLVQPPIISSATDGINAAEKAAGITVGIKGAVVGDVVTVNWGGNTFTATISSTDFDASGLANLAVPSSLISSTQEGRTSVSYHINEGIESPATLILVDSTAPVVLSIDVADRSDTGLSNTDDISQEATPNLRIGLESADSSLVGGLLRLTSNGVLIGSVILTEADRSQGYIDITTSALGADGVKQLVATIIDKAGNESAVTALSYTLDTNLQAATLSLNTGSDTGLSNTDNISQDATPTVRISLKADDELTGTTVQLNSNGASVGSAVINATDISRGYIEIETSTLGIDGSKALTATLTDTAGNQSTSAIYTYTLDTTTPALSAKVLGGLDSNPTPTVRISLDSSDSSLLGGKIDLSSGLGSIGSATISQANVNTGYIDIKTRDLGDSGVKNIAISIKDIAGNTQTQSLAYTLKDTTPVAPALPTVKVTNIDISEDSGASNHDFITNVASQTVTATLSDALAKGEVLYGSTDGGANWVNINSMIGSDSTTLTWAGVTLNGSSSLRFKVRNSLGDNGEETSQIYTLDSKAATAPTLDLVESSDTGTSNTDNISYDTSPTIRISLDSQDTSLAGGKVTLNSGTSAVGSVTITATDLSKGYVEITSSALGEDGVKNLNATVEDLAGNITKSTEDLSYTLDTVAMATVSNIAIGEDTGISGEDFVTSVSNQWVSGTLNTKLTSGDTLYGSSDGGENWVNLNNMLGEDGTQLSWSSVSLSGSSSIRFKVTDIAGNSSTESRQDYVLDTTAPTASLSLAGENSDTGASSTDLVSNNPTPTVRINLSGEDSSLEGGQVALSYSGSDIGSALITSTHLSNGYIDIEVDNLGEDGTDKRIYSRIEDLAGNSFSSAALLYTLDTVTPSIPTLELGEDSDTGASSSDNISSDDTPTIRINLYGEDSSLTGGKASIMFNGEAVGFANITGEDLSNGYVEVTTSSLGEDGVKELSATVEDLAGNSSNSSGSLLYTLETEAPTVLSNASTGESFPFSFGGVNNKDATGGTNIDSNSDDPSGLAFDNANGNLIVGGSFVGESIDFSPHNSTLDRAIASRISIDGNSYTDDGFIASYNGDNASLNWVVSIAGEDEDIVNSVTADSSGNIYAVGYFSGDTNIVRTLANDTSSTLGTLSSVNDSVDMFVIKLDSNGGLIWSKAIGGASDNEEATTVAVDADGDIYIGGYFAQTVDFDPNADIHNLTSDPDEDSDNGDAFVLSLDSDGNFRWVKQLGSDNDGDTVDTIAINGDKILIGGTLSSDTDGVNMDDIFSSSSAEFYASSTQADGSSSPSGNDFGFVQSLNANNGTLDWSSVFLAGEEAFGDAEENGVTGVATDSSGNIYVLGNTNDIADLNPDLTATNNSTIIGGDSDYHDDIYLVKLDSSGNYVWHRSLGNKNGETDESGDALHVSHVNDAIYITGDFNGVIDADGAGSGTTDLTSIGGQDAMLLKWDLDGNLIWARQIGGTDYDTGDFFTEDSSGNVYVSGQHKNSVDLDPSANTLIHTAEDGIDSGGRDGFIVKLNQSGDTSRDYNAYANGNQLIFTLQDGLNLDNTNIAAANAFTVTGSDSGTITVNSLSVDATAKTVTLTLASAVVSGETLQLSYTDPTANNDVNAIQDIAGNDLASFTTLAIENITPAVVPEDIRVIVETDGAYIDTNGDGTRGEEDTEAAIFSSGGNADLSVHHVTVHYNSVPSTALDLIGFGEDDQIELDMSAILSSQSIPLSHLGEVNAVSAYANNVSYNIEYINPSQKAVGIDSAGNLRIGDQATNHYTTTYQVHSTSSTISGRPVFYNTRNVTNHIVYDIFNSTNTLANNAGNVTFDDIDFLLYSVSGSGAI